MTKSKYVIIVKLNNDKTIIDNTNKTKDIDEWFNLDKDMQEQVAEIFVYEKQGLGYTQTYFESKRKVGF